MDTNKQENFKQSKLAIFHGQKIRRAIYKNEWWFSVVDVVEVLSESNNPIDYLKKLRKRDIEIGNYLGTNCPQVEMITSTGKKRKILAGNTEQIFRIIQSIPSPKAEPFKCWLAKVGYERVKEIKDPELATKRARTLYKLKGYNDAWIEKRLRGIAVREELTDEWQKRDINKQREFAILTAEISKATFDMTPSEYKKYKGLERENLRDHMDGLELIFSMLGEASTTKIARAKDTQGFIENRLAAKKGGKIAGDARKNLEIAAGERVIKRENSLDKPQNRELIN